MPYFIYENWQAGPHKAVLHVGECQFCKNGQGLAGGSDPKHGKCHGPYSDITAGRAAQSRLPVEVRKDCSSCIGRQQ